MVQVASVRTHWMSCVARSGCCHRASRAAVAVSAQLASVAASGAVGGAPEMSFQSAWKRRSEGGAAIVSRKAFSLTWCASSSCG